MFASDTAIIQDLKVAISYLRSQMEELRDASSSSALAEVSTYSPSVQKTYALGLRHGQRLLVDVLVKTFMLVAKDIDGVQLKTFDALLEAMQHKTSNRDAVLDTHAHRHIFVARMLANTAGLAVSPAATVEEAAYATNASLRTIEPGVQALEALLVKIEEPSH